MPTVLKDPRITEKVSLLMERGVYTFDVFLDATKRGVLHAIHARYGIVPEKVNMVSVRGKQKFTRGKLGRTACGKKALVYLKKGDKIDVI